MQGHVDAQGSAIAQYHYAWLQAQGHGDPIDDSFILDCYKDASEGGYAPASYECGIMFYHGKGAPASKSMAQSYFERAVAQAKHDFISKITDDNLTTTISAGNLAKSFLAEHY